MSGVHDAESHDFREIRSGPEGLKSGIDAVAHETGEGNDPIGPLLKKCKEPSKCIAFGFRHLPGDFGRAHRWRVPYHQVERQYQQQVDAGNGHESLPPTHNIHQEGQGNRCGHVSHSPDGKDNAGKGGEGGGLKPGG